MLTASELKVILAEYDIRPKKYLGQNFLVDRNIAEKMVQMCELSEDDWVVEIGAGLGALTERLGNLVEKVVAVEKDRRLCAALDKSLRGFDNVKIVCADFLKLDLRQVFEANLKKAKIIGNLPYYITTPIIEKLIKDKDMFDSIFITVQKEVAQRLCAKPGGKDYGSISCYLQFFMKPNILFNIKRHAFYPQPEVDSVFLELKVLPKPPVEVDDCERLFKIIRSTFGKRRKTILNSLLASKLTKLDKNDLIAALKSVKIDPNLRPEKLSLEDFATIANAI
ncbi:MAG: hypothetical protein AMJ78_03320 [Omnitrophica WOR_2 bacterium SM23_29]|nr:MAG: hypothetical protein AMJ78_03320 [Omnitrophica WOR_2 bacterium SM23_29]